MHGNPWFRLLRHEVEALVKEKSGKDHLHKKKLEKELSDLNKEARKLKSRLKAIEQRRAGLMKDIEGRLTLNVTSAPIPDLGSRVSERRMVE